MAPAEMKAVRPALQAHLFAPNIVIVCWFTIRPSLRELFCADE